MSIVVVDFIKNSTSPKTCFTHSLKHMPQVIGLWFDVQRTWSHLESIFVGSEDIRKQLPIDSERFDNIDNEFKQLMVTMSKTPNVVKVRTGWMDELTKMSTETKWQKYTL